MKKIVTIGGGTGSFTILSGLKTLGDVSISAIVSMADDGGSTGELRDELGVLPSGDVRQCLVALSFHTDTVRELINYRFGAGGLAGHSFGNLFLAALEKVTGNFVKGVEVASDILKVSGRVIPVTENSAKLIIELKDGSIIKGENKINHADFAQRGIKKIYYKPDVLLNGSARKAILEADYIILGPGNYYCSVIPNLIVNGFKNTLKKSRAKIIFPVNLTNKHGHNKGWTVSRYVENIEGYLGRKVDIILINSKKPNKEQMEAYELEEGEGVVISDDTKDKRIIRADIISSKVYKRKKADKFSVVRGFIRHDPKKLADLIAKIIK